MPYFDWNACPFECCVYRTWKAKKVVTILRERRLDSPVAFELRVGESVQAFTGVVVTKKAGEVSALRDGFVGESNIPIRAGDVVQVLRPQGEGFWKIWFNGQIDSEDLLNLDDASDLGWRFIGRPDITWWVKIRTGDGRVGWTTATEDFDGRVVDINGVRTRPAPFDDATPTMASSAHAQRHRRPVVGHGPRRAVRRDT